MDAQGVCICFAQRQHSYGRLRVFGYFAVCAAQCQICQCQSQSPRGFSEECPENDPPTHSNTIAKGASGFRYHADSAEMASASFHFPASKPLQRPPCRPRCGINGQDFSCYCAKHTCETVRPRTQRAASLLLCQGPPCVRSLRHTGLPPAHLPTCSDSGFRLGDHLAAPSTPWQARQRLSLHGDHVGWQQK